MNKIVVPSFYIYEFFGDTDIVAQYANIVSTSQQIHWEQSLVTEDHSKNYTWLGQPIPKHDKMFDWLQSCIDHVATAHFVESKLKICDAWLTKSTLGLQSNFHSHNYSIFSGLLYLDDHSAATQFLLDDTLFNHFSKYGIQSRKTIENISIKPEKGKLIIWPSYIHHKISVNRSPKTRYTLAFNTFFDGVVSATKTGELVLQTKEPKFIL